MLPPSPAQKLPVLPISLVNFSLLLAPVLFLSPALAASSVTPFPSPWPCMYLCLFVSACLWVHTSGCREALPSDLFCFSVCNIDLALSHFEMKNKLKQLLRITPPQKQQQWVAVRGRQLKASTAKKLEVHVASSADMQHSLKIDYTLTQKPCDYHMALNWLQEPWSIFWFIFIG